MPTSQDAAIYCRISQDRIGKQAGVQRQEEDCRKLAASLGWNVVEVYVDNDVSAYAARARPAYSTLLEDIATGRVAALLAWHPDRLYRQMRDLVDLVELVKVHEVDIATVQAGRVDLSTASGRMHASMLGSVAVYESEIKSERVTRAAEQRARAGRWSGGLRPYGYEADGVTVRESEAEHVRSVVADLLAGVSLREATRRITTAGALTAGGKEWTTQHLRTAILSPRVAGLASYHGAIVGTAEWPALVPEEDWRSAKAILENPSRRSTPGPTPRHLLSGIVECGRPECGKACRVSVSSRGGTRALRYRCPRGHVIREKGALETYVMEATFALLRQNDVRPSQVRHDLGAQAEGEALRKRLETLAEDYADGVLTREQLTAATGRARDRIAELDAKIAASSRRSALDDLAGADDARSAWEGLTLARQRAILAELWTVRLHPMQSGQRGVNERGVELIPRWM